MEIGGKFINFVEMGEYAICIMGLGGWTPLYLFVCVSACLCVCLSLCMYVSMLVCFYTHMFVCLSAWYGVYVLVECVNE